MHFHSKAKTINDTKEFTFEPMVSFKQKSNLRNRKKLLTDFCSLDTQYI